MLNQAAHFPSAVMRYVQPRATLWTGLKQDANYHTIKDTKRALYRPKFCLPKGTVSGRKTRVL